MVNELRDCIITCSVCGKNYHENEVNIIDFDLDLCINCEKEHLEKLKREKKYQLKKRELDNMLEFSKSNVAGTITVEIPLSDDDIFTIMVGSLEGGSTSWLGLDNNRGAWQDRPKTVPISAWATMVLLDGDRLHFYDVEDPEEKWTLTLDKLLNGYKLNHQKRPFDNDLENADAITYDCIMQYALFGKIVYG
jgi:hypothetical protein